MIVLAVDAEDIGTVALAAMCWVSGIPLDRSDETRVRELAASVEAVLGELRDTNDKPIRLRDGWWQPDDDC